MRRNMRRLLPSTCVIERKTVENVGGEEVETWKDHATGIACRIAPVGGGEMGESGGRISEEATALITLPAEQDIEEADRIVLSEETYEVVLVRKRGSWELTRRCEVKEAV
jgi:head-tail adaptor